MGTRFTLVLPGMSEQAGAALAALAEDEVRTQERLMSRYDVHSPVSAINRAAASKPVPVPQPLWQILITCREHWQRSGGAFDIARAMPGESISETDTQRVALDSATHTARLHSPDVELDLGGIGKGIALESVAQEFRRRGVESAFMSFGESSITVLGSHPAGAAWPVGIADLFRPDISRHTFHLNDASLSTSGNRPAQPAHIVDRDGHAVEGCRTMSVSSPSAIDAEVLSTALLALPAQDRAAVLANYPGATAVEIVHASRDGAGTVTWKHEP